MAGSQTNRKWWTLGRRLRRHLHAPARHHRGEHGAAEDPAGPRRQLLRPAVGHRRLRALARRARPDRGLARRPARAPPRLRRRAGDLLRRLAALRARPRPDLPQPRPRPAGGRRRDHVRGQPRAGRPGVPRRPRAGHGDGHLRRLDRRLRRRRPADRRRPHRRPRLAVGLPRQRPGRDRDDRASPTGSCASRATRTPRGSTGAASLTFSAALLVLVLALVRGNDEGWGSTADRLAARRRRGADGGLRRRSSAASPSRCSRSASSAAAPSPASSSRPSRSRPRCSRCSST